MTTIIKASLWCFAFCFAIRLAAQDNIQPSLMVFPSDNLLYRLKCVEKVPFEGDTLIKRNYQKAFLENSDLNFIISGIQDAFGQKGYPIEDLQQSLKSLERRKMDKRLEQTNLDIKTLLMMEARPDIILEITYELRKTGMEYKFSFDLRGLDAYTNKAVANAVNPGEGTIGNDVKTLMMEQLENNMTNFTQSLNEYFTRLREQNAREIIVRFEAKGDGISDFRREKCGTVPYQQWFRTWLLNHVEINTVKPSPARPSELEFTQIKIPLKDKDGIPITAGDWIYPIIEDISKQCGVEAYDNTQGLGEAVIILVKE